MHAGVLVSWALCALMALGVRGDETAKDGEVYVLGDDDFEAFIKNNPFVLAEFYAPWCGHCKALEPEYQKAAKELAEENSQVKLAKVDATIHSKIAESYGVQGFPTIKFFKSGYDIEYTGGRTADDIIAWVTKKSGPPAATVTSVETVQDMTNKMEVLIVGLFKDAECDAAKAFTAAADQLEAVFAISSTPEVFEHFGKQEDAVLLLKHFDDKRVDLDDSEQFTEEGIKGFVTKNWLPWVMEYSDSTATKIFGGDITQHVILFGDLKGDAVKGLMGCYSETARKYLGDMMFVTVDTSIEDHSNVMQFFGIEMNTPLALRAVNLEVDMLKFAPEGDVSCEVFESFGRDFKEGNLKPYRMSQDVPADWDNEPVKVLVGKNFDEVARKSGKLVFVKFYAPWCGHCQAMAPTWEDLAKAYADNDKVMIAKLDGTLNEVEGVGIQGFPTLKVFYNDEELDYEGARSFESLKDYVDAVLRGEKPTAGHDHGHDHAHGDHDHEHVHEHEHEDEDDDADTVYDDANAELEVGAHEEETAEEKPRDEL